MTEFAAADSRGLVVERVMPHPPEKNLARTAKSPAATTGYVFDRIAPVTHYGLYALVLLMAGTGRDRNFGRAQ
jgi:hypothetical protein